MAHMFFFLGGGSYFSKPTEAFSVEKTNLRFFLEVGRSGLKTRLFLEKRCIFGDQKTHKYPRYRAYSSGFPMTGYVGIGVHPCLSPERTVEFFQSF